MKVLEKYIEFCKNKGIDFIFNDKVNPYDDTTLFCSAGMAQFKKEFVDYNIKNKY